MLAAGWGVARACAPDFLRPVCSSVRHPDLPRTAFIDGRLGVLQPTFAKSYQVIAYRYLNGIGMNAREREQARDYYKDRSESSWDKTGTDWVERWREVRGRIRTPAAPPPPPAVTGGRQAYNPATNHFFLNCAEDAFRVAVHTLEARRAQFGGASAAFQSWVGAQDAVFAQCDGGKHPMPQQANADLPEPIRMDRDYQIAAAQFYAADYGAALARFQGIAREARSPWSTISRYLVVRTMLRMESPGLRAQAQAILDDPKLGAVHGMTWNLVDRAGVLERDPSYFRALARLLASRGQDNGLREELWNYTNMYRDLVGDGSKFRDGSLTDWIYSFQSQKASEFGYAATRWKRTKSAAWLLSALEHADAEGAAREGLLDAAAVVPEGSPAYLTARFHLLRLGLTSGEARKGLDALLTGAALKGLPSSANLFRGLRMMAAPSLEDFVGFAVRKPVYFAYQTDVEETGGFWSDRIHQPNFGELFDADSTEVLNHETPLRMLKEAALSDRLPVRVHEEALLVAFTRGLMLNADIDDVAAKLDGAEEYIKQSDAAGKRFAAAFFLLHHPEARPYFGTGITRHATPGRLDPYRDNWWCPMDIEIQLDSRNNDASGYPNPNQLEELTIHETPPFLRGVVGDEAKREFAELGKLGAATDFLGAIVLAYARNHADEPRVPEALYWLVRAGHYGCGDTNTWKTTKAAFERLQLGYPKSTWAKQTPYWARGDDIREQIRARKQSEAVH
jgi:hypothetical protein